MRQTLGGVLAALLLTIATAAHGKDQSYTLHHLVLGAYRIDVWGGPGSALSIRRNGKLVFRRRDTEFRQYFIANGSNLYTSEDSPLRRQDMLIVKESHLSTHCCDSALVFQLAPEFRLIAEIPFAFWLRNDGWGVYPDPIRADLLVLDQGPDPGTSISAMVFCEMNLRLRGGELHVDANLQRQPPYSRRLLTFLASKLREGRQWGEAGGGLTEQYNPSLVQFMMSLIYTGNAYQAHELMDMAWPADLPGKAGWAATFWADREKSPWWREIAALSQRTDDAGPASRDEDLWPVCYSPVE